MPHTCMAYMGRAPEQYSVFGKSLKMDTPYLSKYEGPQEKLIGFELGAAPRVQIR